jgi:hypothetical protein
MRAGAAAPAQMGLDDAQQVMQHGADGLRLAALDTSSAVWAPSGPTGAPATAG